MIICYISSDVSYKTLSYMTNIFHYSLQNRLRISISKILQPFSNFRERLYFMKIVMLLILPFSSIQLNCTFLVGITTTGTTISPFSCSCSQTFPQLLLLQANLQNICYVIILYQKMPFYVYLHIAHHAIMVCK